MHAPPSATEALLGVHLTAQQCRLRVLAHVRGAGAPDGANRMSGAHSSTCASLDGLLPNVARCEELLRASPTAASLRALGAWVLEAVCVKRAALRVACA
jgi:hypothetical protein